MAHARAYTYTHTYTHTHILYLIITGVQATKFFFANDDELFIKTKITFFC